MANANRPSGLSPVRYLNGAPWTGGGNIYCIPSTDNNAFAIGDPLVLAGGADGNGVATVTLATAGATNSVLGPIVSMGGTKYGGALADPTNLNTIVIPATKAHDYYVLVVDDPMVVFEIQEVGTGTYLTAAEVGNNADLLAGTNNGYVSGWLLNNVGEGTGATLQVKLLGLSQRSGNAFGQYAKWLVKINLHCYSIGQVGY